MEKTLKSGITGVESREAASDIRAVHDSDGKLLLRLNVRSFRKIEDSLRRGEVRGVLSGVAAFEPDQVPVVEDFGPISIPYRAEAKGSRELDEAAFKALQTQFPSSIGYFRSLRHVNAEASAEDYRLLQLMFGDRGGLLILVQTAMLGVSILHVFARDRGADLRFIGRFPLYEEPKSESPAPVASPPPAKLADPPAPPKTETRRTREDLPPPPKTETRRTRERAPQAPGVAAEEQEEVPRPLAGSKRQVVNIAIATGIVLAAGLLTFGLLRVTQRTKDSQPAPGQATKKTARGVPVSLFIQEAGDHVDLIWDPAQDEVIQASQGSLTIFDNNTAHHEELNQAQLQKGRYSYKPVLHDVIFQLVFLRPDNTFSVGTASGSNLLQKNEAVVPAGPRVRPPADVAADGRTRAPVTMSRSTGPVPYTESRSPEPSAPRSAEIRTPPAPAPEVSRPPQRKEPEPAPAPAAPAAAAPRSTTTETRQPAAPPVAVTPAPPAETPAAERSPTPGPPLAENTTSVPAHDPGMDGQQIVSFTGPAPLRRVRPNLPPNVLSLVHDDMTVKVQVTVNAKGKVTHAELIPERGIPNAVGIYAVQAAKQWQFEPGRRDGSAVESRTTVQFRFERQ